MNKKYGKSKSQRGKEKLRRERVFQMLTGEEWLTKSEMADRLDVSRLTIQRDKRVLQRRLKRYWAEQKRRFDSEWTEKVKRMSMSQRDAMLGILFGTHRIKGKPRGKPFTSKYQPRWKRRK